MTASAVELKEHGGGFIKERSSAQSRRCHLRPDIRARNIDCTTAKASVALSLVSATPTPRIVSQLLLCGVTVPMKKG